jgi:energy-coupling factor transporter ATP-binding protein EcfA2
VACDATPAGFLAWAGASAPALETPAARLFSLSGLAPPPVTVKEARAALPPVARAEPPEPNGRPRLRLPWRRGPQPALALRGVWLEVEDGPVVLRGITLELAPGERVALMGRNGAGKSTLLRVAKGLAKPSRGRVERADEVALLLQNPGDYLIHDHAVDDAGAGGVLRAGLRGREDANPRDLSGGERQRLALEVVLSGSPAAAVLLDEPTRGMDRLHQDELTARIGELASGGAGVIVATHDTEFTAAFADRVVLLGQGVVIADGPPAEILGGGRHFSTQVARITDGAALLPEDGAAALRPAQVVEAAR